MAITQKKKIIVDYIFMGFLCLCVILVAWLATQYSSKLLSDEKTKESTTAIMKIEVTKTQLDSTQQLLQVYKRKLIKTEMELARLRIILSQARKSEIKRLASQQTAFKTLLDKHQSSERDTVEIKREREE